MVQTMYDKYDELEESTRNYEEEDYFYELLRKENLETKEKQIKYCWDLKRKRIYSGYP